MKSFWLCFVPLFVAVDAIGVVPLFLTLTEGLDERRRRAVILQSVVTAGTVAVAFLLFGPALLMSLGISVSDFMIAGGLLLLALSLADLLTGGKHHRQTDPETLGAVPIGIPMITGPAVLTTCILLGQTHSRWLTASAALLNIGLAGIAFLFAAPITMKLGRTGTKSISKVASLLLAAIAVMLIRKGIVATIAADR
jgi:multiple antibiotic resistance protein